jgi:hypothetical protein
MRARPYPAVAALSILALAGCTSGSHTASPSNTPVPSQSGSAAVPLPDPLPTDLPVGTKTLISRTSQGTQTVTLPNLGNDKTVSVKWACEGSTTLKITDAGKALVASGCTPSGTQFPIYGGDIPRSLITSTTWKIEADPSTTWRIVIYAAP